MNILAAILAILCAVMILFFNGAGKTHKKHLSIIAWICFVAVSLYAVLLLFKLLSPNWLLILGLMVLLDELIYHQGNIAAIVQKYQDRIKVLLSRIKNRLGKKEAADKSHINEKGLL